jgi:hypothetical protein
MAPGTRTRRVRPQKLRAIPVGMDAKTLNEGRQARPRSARGELVARLLTGAWRAAPPPVCLSAEDLAPVAELALRSGAAGLAWCKVRQSDLQTSRAARKLQQAYRLHSLQAALHERSLKQAIPLLRERGVEPLLVKGWSVARLYPELGMRPYGDLDLCVLPCEYEKAQAALKSLEGQSCDVDLHSGFGKFYDRRAEEIFARSRVVTLNGLEVRVLSAEDNLRFLCVHLLRHGAVRPLWLCDIAALVETRPGDFNWDRCLAGPRRQANWVACAVGLAHLLLGAEVEGTPVAGRASRLPRWLVPAVLEGWGAPYQFPNQIAAYLRQPAGKLMGLMRELPRHWPNPIEATMTLGGPFNGLPRLPFQVGHVFSRAAGLLLELSRGQRGAV